MHDKKNAYHVMMFAQGDSKTNSVNPQKSCANY